MKPYPSPPLSWEYKGPSELVDMLGALDEFDVLAFFLDGIAFLLLWVDELVKVELDDDGAVFLTRKGGGWFPV